jgi:hypothetical protein
MFEIIIAYLLITVVTYSITKDKGKSFSWPVSFIKFIAENVTKGISYFKQDS